MNRQTQFQFWYVILALLGVVLIRDLWVTAESTMPIPYSQFESYLQENAIDVC